MEYSRNELLEDLKNAIVEIHFTKVDGSKRVMKCTLWSHYLPPQQNLKEELDSFHKAKENADLIAVWDMDSKDWRSFRVSSVYYAQRVDIGY